MYNIQTNFKSIQILFTLLMLNIVLPYCVKATQTKISKFPAPLYKAWRYASGCVTLTSLTHKFNTLA